MAARKLQAEVDRTLKRIEEGMLEFDAVYERVIAAETQPQKEKYEEELKKETKKLQKYRDFLKLWATSADIKNKQPLLDARKNIERKMEIFKAVEKETKVKAYSREGLSRDTPMTAEERKRMKSREWINDCLQSLNDQIDEYEAEIESYESSKSKRDKEISAHLEGVVKHHRWHIDRLEALQRMLDNATVDADDVDMIKDNIDDYIEHAKEEDYDVDLELYDGFTGLTLGASDESAGDDSAADEPASGAGKRDTKATPPATTVKPVNATINTTPGRATASAATTNDTGAAGKGKPTTTTTATPVKPPALKPATVPTAATVVTATTTTTVTGAATATTAAAAKGKGGVSSSTPTTAPPGVASVVTPAPAVVQPVILRSQTAPTPSTASITPAQPNIPGAMNTASHPQKVPETLASILTRKTAPAAAPSPAPLTYASVTNPAAAADKPFSASTTASSAPSTGDANAQIAAALAAANLPAPSPAVLENPLLPLPVPTQRFNMAALQLSMSNIPEPLDSERPKQYIPKYPTTITHPSFPTTPAPALESPQLFERMDVDTLFFLFYYQQGTYLQYLAAKELKRHMWRFHKRFFVWFKRQDDPKHPTSSSTSSESSEQGTYVYFDYEMGWLVRVKKDFVLEQQYLEDELV